MDWFLYDNGLRHERVNDFQLLTIFVKSFILDVWLGSGYASVFDEKYVFALSQSMF